MDLTLFGKYSKVLTQKKEEKEVILVLLKELSGIIFSSEELVIQKKHISFHTSSVKKTMLHQRNVQQRLQEKGYSISL